MSVQAPPATAAETEFRAALAEFLRAARRARGRSAARPTANCVSLAQYHLLEPLAEGALTIGQVAEGAGVAPPTATRMLDGLVERGLVARAADPGDRRAVLVSLTAEGRRACAAKAREVEEGLGRIAAALDTEQQLHGAELLRRLGEVIEEL